MYEWIVSLNRSDSSKDTTVAFDLSVKVKAIISTLTTRLDLPTMCSDILGDAVKPDYYDAKQRDLISGKAIAIVPITCIMATEQQKLLATAAWATTKSCINNAKLARALGVDDPTPSEKSALKRGGTMVEVEKSPTFSAASHNTVAFDTTIDEDDADDFLADVDIPETTVRPPLSKTAIVDATEFYKRFATQVQAELYRAASTTEKIRADEYEAELLMIHSRLQLPTASIGLWGVNLAQHISVYLPGTSPQSKVHATVSDIDLPPPLSLQPGSLRVLLDEPFEGKWYQTLQRKHVIPNQLAVQCARRATPVIITKEINKLPLQQYRSLPAATTSNYLNVDSAESDKAWQWVRGFPYTQMEAITMQTSALQANELRDFLDSHKWLKRMPDPMSHQRDAHIAICDARRQIDPSFSTQSLWTAEEQKKFSPHEPSCSHCCCSPCKECLTSMTATWIKCCSTCTSCTPTVQRVPSEQSIAPPLQAQRTQSVVSRSAISHGRPKSANARVSTSSTTPTKPVTSPAIVEHKPSLREKHPVAVPVAALRKPLPTSKLEPICPVTTRLPPTARNKPTTSEPKASPYKLKDRVVVTVPGTELLQGATAEIKALYLTVKNSTERYVRVILDTQIDGKKVIRVKEIHVTPDNSPVSIQPTAIPPKLKEPVASDESTTARAKPAYVPPFKPGQYVIINHPTDKRRQKLTGFVTDTLQNPFSKPSTYITVDLSPITTKKTSIRIEHKYVSAHPFPHTPCKKARPVSAPDAPSKKRRVLSTGSKDPEVMKTYSDLLVPFIHAAAVKISDITGERPSGRRSRKLKTFPFDYEGFQFAPKQQVDKFFELAAVYAEAYVQANLTRADIYTHHCSTSGYVHAKSQEQLTDPTDPDSFVPELDVAIFHELCTLA